VRSAVTFILLLPCLFLKLFLYVQLWSHAGWSRAWAQMRPDLIGWSLILAVAAGIGTLLHLLVRPRIQQEIGTAQMPERSTGQELSASEALGQRP
jgi:hypothetical protein